MEGDMEKSNMPIREYTLLDFATKYYSIGIITLPINLADSKPLVDIEMLSNKKVTINDITKMFKDLSKEDYGIAMLNNCRNGYFEAIRIRGKGDKLNSILNDILTFPDLRSLGTDKKIAITIHSEGLDITYKIPEKGLQSQTLAEKYDNEGRREPYIEIIGKEGYFTLPPTKGYEHLESYFFPTLISENERNRLLYLSKLLNFPQQNYMSNKEYGKKEKIAHIANVFNNHKESDLVFKSYLLNEFKWVQVSENLWMKKTEEGKEVFGLCDKEKKERFWVSDKVEPFEPNFLYKPFDFEVLNKNGDYMKALEIVCHKVPELDIEDLRLYKKTLKCLRDSHVSILEEYMQPNPYIYTVDNDEKLVIGSIHNLSVLSGKAKVGKTILLNEVTSSAFLDQSVFHYSEELSDKKIVYIDTEQSRNHSRLIIERIVRKTKKERKFLESRFELYNVTNLSQDVRVNVIEEKLYSDPDIRILIIDGIVDLVSNYNNPQEVSELMTKLLKWKDENPVHIMVVIHENKGNSLLRGHLGTELMNKAETIIGVSKTKDIIKVKCKASRNKEFNEMAFNILDEGFLEHISGFKDNKSENSIESFTHEEHIELLTTVFENIEEMQYEELRTNLKESLFIGFEIKIGDNKVKNLIAKYVDDNLLQKVKRGVYTFKSDLFGSGVQSEDEVKTT